MAAVFDDRHLHPQADAEVRHAVLARVAHRLDLALDAALAEAARHQDRVHILEHLHAVLLDVGGLDVVDVDARAALQAAVHQRLVQRQVGVADLHVLADHGDVDLAVGVGPAAHHLAPLGQVGGGHLEAQLVDDDVVERLLVQQHRDLVDVVGVDRGDDRALLDVGEQRDLAALLLGQRVLAAAQQDVRLDADAAQLLHRVLRRLGLDLARAADDRHQRQVHVHDVAAPELDAELADGLEERQRLDVADRTADLDHAHVGAFRAELDAALDLVGDVRNDLHGGAEVVAAALLGDDPLVDAAGGEVAVVPRGRAHEALVVPEVEVGLGAVLGDEHLAVLERAHRARIDVDVRVELDHRNLEAARLEDRAERGGGDALAQRGHDAAGDEYETRHKLQIEGFSRRLSQRCPRNAGSDDGPAG